MPIARNHISRFVSLSIIANARAAWIVPGYLDDLASLNGRAPCRLGWRWLPVAPGWGIPAGFSCVPFSHLIGCRYWPSKRSENVATGIVKWFNATKGYGFIQPDGGGKDVFVHISAVEKAGFTGLAEGAKISYEVVNDRGKDPAGNLRL